ncbi:zinc-ribbon domain-containing protein [Streptomyces sp. NRRL S-920]|uniref:zinc-ribbon domain-containing protein n=1 Tax=Streptomyces sp. NRRL S-920 TaxID=1463921 RepID=UPI00099600AD
MTVIRPRRPAPGKSVEDLAPQLVKEWHSALNAPLSPADVSAGSSLHAWWRCVECGHEWSARVSSRTRVNGAGCKPCGHRRAGDKKASPRHGISLTDAYPHLARQWDAHRNAPMTPDRVGPGSSQPYWWVCVCGRSWKARPSDRTRSDRGPSSALCPYCVRTVTQRQRARPLHERSLMALHPELAAQWHPTRNAQLQPHAVSPGSNRKVWWRGLCGHDWQTRVSRRVEGRGLPLLRRPARRIRKRSCNMGAKDRCTVASDA